MSSTVYGRHIVNIVQNTDEKWVISFRKEPHRSGQRNPEMDSFTTKKEALQAAKSYIDSPSPPDNDELLEAIKTNANPSSGEASFSEQNARQWVGFHARYWPIHEMILRLQDEGKLSIKYAEGNGSRFLVAVE